MTTEPATLNKNSDETDAENLDMRSEIPGMDATAPNRYESSANEGNTPDQAQNGRDGGGTSDGDEGSS